MPSPRIHSDSDYSTRWPDNFFAGIYMEVNISFEAINTMESLQIKILELNLHMCIWSYDWKKNSHLILLRKCSVTLVKTFPIGNHWNETYLSRFHVFRLIILADPYKFHETFSTRRSNKTVPLPRLVVLARSDVTLDSKQTKFSNLVKTSFGRNFYSILLILNYPKKGARPWNYPMCWNIQFFFFNLRKLICAIWWMLGAWMDKKKSTRPPFFLTKKRKEICALCSPPSTGN